MNFFVLFMLMLNTNLRWNFETLFTFLTVVDTSAGGELSSEWWLLQMM